MISGYLTCGLTGLEVRKSRFEGSSCNLAWTGIGMPPTTMAYVGACQNALAGGGLRLQLDLLSSSRLTVTLPKSDSCITITFAVLVFENLNGNNLAFSCQRCP